LPVIQPAIKPTMIHQIINILPPCWGEAVRVPRQSDTRQAKTADRRDF
jgi:hypothetical protein